MKSKAGRSADGDNQREKFIDLKYISPNIYTGSKSPTLGGLRVAPPCNGVGETLHQQKYKVIWLS